MKILVTEIQYSNIIEPFIQEQDLGLKGKTLAPKYAPPKEFGKSNPGGDVHTRNTVLQIVTAFIPYVGPFISAGIGATDARLYWNEGDKTSAVITGVFSMLPFLKFVPGAKELGSKGMSLLSDKLLKGGKLTNAELEIIKKIKDYTPEIKDSMSKMGTKLKNVSNDIQKYKNSFISKFGESEYNTLIAKFLYGEIDQPMFLSKLKSFVDEKLVKVYRAGEKNAEMFYVSPNKNYVVKHYQTPSKPMYSMNLKLGQILDLTKLNPESLKITELLDFLRKSGVKFTKAEESALLAKHVSQKSTPLKKEYVSQPLFLYLFRDPIISNAAKRSGFNSIKQLETSAITNKGFDWSNAAETYLMLTPQ